VAATGAPRSLLLFDGLADPAPELGSLVQACRDQNINLLVVGTERERRVVRLYTDVPPDALLVGRDTRIERLSDIDIDRLLEKLRSARRLGRLSGPLPCGSARSFSASRRTASIRRHGRAGGRTCFLGPDQAGVSFYPYQSLPRCVCRVCLSYALGYRSQSPSCVRLRD